MEFIINFIQGLINAIFGFLKWILALPFKIANFFIVLMGILATAALLWWIYSVPMPPQPVVSTATATTTPTAGTSLPAQ
jgi:hypothetical protein